MLYRQAHIRYLGKRCQNQSPDAIQVLDNCGAMQKHVVDIGGAQIKSMVGNINANLIEGSL